MIDLKAARQEPDRFRAALARRGAAEDFDALLDADQRWRQQTERSQSLRAQQKRSSRGAPTPEEIEHLKALKRDLTVAEKELADADAQRTELLHRIPNLPDSTAPDGMEEDDAQHVKHWGKSPPSPSNRKTTYRSPHLPAG